MATKVRTALLMRGFAPTGPHMGGEGRVGEGDQQADKIYARSFPANPTTHPNSKQSSRALHQVLTPVTPAISQPTVHTQIVITVVSAHACTVGSLIHTSHEQGG